jgi:hypothetical protein
VAPTVKDIIPPRVFSEVANHLRQRGAKAHKDWLVNQANEDSLTGAAFAKFRTGRTRRVYVERDEWLWRVSTNKFGSGGKGSEERLTGADGIIEIEIRHLGSGQIEKKGLLVQAKKRWKGNNSKLLQQVSDMEHLVSRSSAIIDYGPLGYRGIDGHEALRVAADRRLVEPTADLGLGDFLADRFLTCEAGRRGLFFDAHRRILYLPGEPEAIAFRIPERMRIEFEELRRVR